jgi:hypothetical protein
VSENVVLSLDPSSKAVGWAVMTGPACVLQGGIITPPNNAAPARERIYRMAQELRGLLREIRPGRILIEWPSGHVGTKRHRGGGAGLSVYGCGVGYIVATADAYCEFDAIAEVVTITETDWTRGVRKPERQAAVISLLPQYDASLDPGGDLADAIGLAVWWFRGQAIAEAVTVNVINNGRKPPEGKVIQEVVVEARGQTE